MSEQNNGQVSTLQRPTTDNREGWQAYWKQQGQPWRTEPEIDSKRQKYLEERRAIVPSIEKGIYPFKDIKLSRADVEWLLTTHENGRGPLNWKKLSKKEREGTLEQQRKGLDLRGADLRGADLQELPLACLNGGLSVHNLLENLFLREDQHNEIPVVHLEGANLKGAYLEGAILGRAHLEGADISFAYLHHADLTEAHLEGADLTCTDLRCIIRQGHLERAILANANLKRAVCQRAHLEGANFEGACLERTIFSDAYLEGAYFEGANLKKTIFTSAHLEGTDLKGVHLEGADFQGAYLSGANLEGAHLEQANLEGAHLEGKLTHSDDLERIKWVYETIPISELRYPHSLLKYKVDKASVRVLVSLGTTQHNFIDFPTKLSPTNLRNVYFDGMTNLVNVIWGSNDHGYASLADIIWNNVNLAVVKWSQIKMLGDESVARKSKRPDDFESAARANRQLAVVLLNQGLNEDAARFAYRAQLMQRTLFRRKKKLWQYLFSLFMDILAGYGYKPWRSFMAYLIVIATFSITYFIIGQTVGPTLSPLGSFVFSMTSFHGRGFFPGGIGLDDPLTVVAAFEAFIGLLIEVTFIATLTQRLFGK